MMFRHQKPPTAVSRGCFRFANQPRSSTRQRFFVREHQSVLSVVHVVAIQQAPGKEMQTIDVL
jgi:hypothetical protein